MGRLAIGTPVEVIDTGSPRLGRSGLVIQKPFHIDYMVQFFDDGEDDEVIGYTANQVKPLDPLGDTSGLSWRHLKRTKDVDTDEGKIWLDFENEEGIVVIFHRHLGKVTETVVHADRIWELAEIVDQMKRCIELHRKQTQSAAPENAAS